MGATRHQEQRKGGGGLRLNASPGAAVDGVSPVPAQMWRGVSPAPAQMCLGEGRPPFHFRCGRLQPPDRELDRRAHQSRQRRLARIHGERLPRMAHLGRIRAGTGPLTSPPGLCHACARRAGLPERAVEDLQLAQEPASASGAPRARRPRPIRAQRWIEDRSVFSCAQKPTKSATRRMSCAGTTAH
jgi:hypothetical protein